jgi:glyoxylase-like metal-dependent hydrolase (beta-lactamase superfamily II)
VRRRDPFTPGVAHEVAQGVRRVTAGNPGRMTGPGTNTYLVGDDAVVVVDPGPDDDAHLDAIAAHGAGRIRWIVTTHTHPDHSPGAAGLARRTGADVLGFAARDGFEPGRLLRDGEHAGVGRWRLRALHTPGHARGHLCFYEERTGALVTGDNIVGLGSVLIDPPEGNMRDYLASLERYRALLPNVRVLFGGHGAAVASPRAKIEEYIAHRLEREANILRAVGEGAQTPPEIVARVYTDVHPKLHALAERAVLAHLSKLEADGRVRRRAGGDFYAAVDAGAVVS